MEAIQYISSAYLTILLVLQDMLRQYICATSGKVLFTPKGRAWNRAAPVTGATATTALLSLLYSQMHSSFIVQVRQSFLKPFACLPCS